MVRLTGAGHLARLLLRSSPDEVSAPTDQVVCRFRFVCACGLTFFADLPVRGDTVPPDRRCRCCDRTVRGRLDEARHATLDATLAETLRNPPNLRE